MTKDWVEQLQTQPSQHRVYAGDGTTVRERGLEWSPASGAGWVDDPADYIAEPALRDAVNVALTLGQPLLVTGEPGTGKTQLAGSVAWELELPPPLVFNTKTTSTSRDLFYRYDSLRHFHDAQFGTDKPEIGSYISYECLGLAILLALPPAEANEVLPAEYRDRGPIRSVVLIDEIDKAPRDLPNDVLNEIEGMEFTVKETGRRFVASTEYRPIVILTSNSEKTLPDAFLRRCVYYHIPFPSGERLRDIVTRRLGPDGGFAPDRLEHVIQHFARIRELGLRKPPATAELLSWARVLRRLDLDVENLRPGEAETLAFTYSILAKSREDLELLRSRIG